MSIKQKSGLKVLLVGFFASFLFFSVLLSAASGFISRALAATTTYNYTDSSFSKIVGPEGTFNSTGNGTYTHTFGSCPYIIRTTNGKNGDTSGTITACNSSPRNISIGLPPSRTITGVFLNHSTISSGGVKYVDDKIDDDLEFQATDGSNTCINNSRIYNFSTNKSGNNSVHATEKVLIDIYGIPGGGNRNCVKNTYTIQLMGPTAAYQTYFLWSDAGTIVTSDGGSAIFTQSKGSGPFFGNAGTSVDSNCASSISASVGARSGTITLRNSQLKQGWPNEIYDADNNLKDDGNGCQVSGGINIVIGNTANAKKPAGTGTITGNNTNDQGTANSCESKGGALSWIMCPVIEIIDNATNALDSGIRHQLETPDPNGTCDIQVNPGNKDCNLYKTWGRLRNIALILLVPIMLVMVIGTALGFSFVDAYTVKRAMPRFLIAILFISVSWYITAFLITVTNAVGQGILGLVTQPFGLADKSLGSLINIGPGVGATGLTVFGGIILAASTNIGIVLSFALVAVVALFTGFMILVVRQVLIFALLLLAPLAILSWIFPNNNDLWKLWWGTFSKLLLMFPLIMLLIGAGRIGASIIPLQQGSDSLFTQILVIIAYVTPYFFIPLTFKFAGGLLGNLAGIVNDRGRGLFDRQRKYREEKRAELRQRAGAERRWNPQNRITRGLRANKIASWVASPGANAAYYGRRLPGLSGKGEKIKAQIDAATMDQTGKLYQELQNVFSFNDKAGRALSGAHGDFTQATQDKLRSAGLLGKMPTTMNEIQTMANILSQSESDTERLAANPLLTSGGRLTSLYSDPEMLKANTAAAGAMLMSAHGFASGADLAEVGNKLVAGGMSADLAQALVSRAQVMGQQQRPDIKAGYGVVVKNGKFVDGMSIDGGRAMDLLATIGQGDLVQAKSGFIKKMADPIKFIIQNGGTEAAAQAVAQVEEKRARGMTTEQIQAEPGGQRLIAFATAQRMAPVLMKEIVQAGSQYSSSPVDTQAEARKIIEELHLEPQRDEFERAYNRQAAGAGPTATGEGGDAAGPAAGPAGE